LIWVRWEEPVDAFRREGEEVLRMRRRRKKGPTRYDPQAWGPYESRRDPKGEVVEGRKNEGMGSGGKRMPTTMNQPKASSIRKERWGQVV